MYNSQLLLVLRTFERKEQIKFEKFLHSPYFHKKNPSKELYLLWQYLAKGIKHKGKGKEYFEKEKVYPHLFPQQQFDKNKLEKLMSQLFSLVKSFLIQQQLEQQTGERARNIHLMTAYSERQLWRPFNQLSRKLIPPQEDEMTSWNSQFYEEELWRQRKITSFQLQDDNRKTDLNLPNTHYYLDLYFLVLKLEYAFQLLARNMFVFPIDSPESFKTLEAVMPVVASQYLEIPIIRLYLKAYQLLQFFYQKEGEDHHQSFNQLLEEYAAVIPYTPLKALQTLNRNYAVYKYREGSLTTLESTFQLYKAHLQQGFLYTDGQISHATLSNMVTIGLRSKAQGWVYQFLADHRTRIGGTKNPEMVYQYHLGQYFFGIQDYDNALNHLAYSFEDPFYKLAARRLEVKILYEINSEIFDAKLDAFKLFLYRLSEEAAKYENKKDNQHFTDLLKQVKHSKTYKNAMRIEKLLHKAQQFKRLADKEWIIEKLEALR